MARESITITALPGGGYQVTSTESEMGGMADQPLDETVQSLDEVMEVVMRELGDDQMAATEQMPGDGDAAAPQGDAASADQMWNEEAQLRQQRMA